MNKSTAQRTEQCVTNRRRFLERLGQTTVVGAGSCVMAAGTAGGDDRSQITAEKQVRQRRLGKTGLMVSEIGFGGHSWSFKPLQHTASSGRADHAGRGESGAGDR